MAEYWSTLDVDLHLAVDPASGRRVGLEASAGLFAGVLFCVGAVAPLGQVPARARRSPMVRCDSTSRRAAFSTATSPSRCPRASLR